MKISKNGRFWKNSQGVVQWKFSKMSFLEKFQRGNTAKIFENQKNRVLRGLFLNWSLSGCSLLSKSKSLVSPDRVKRKTNDLKTVTRAPKSSKPVENGLENLKLGPGLRSTVNPWSKIFKIWKICWLRILVFVCCPMPN